MTNYFMWKLCETREFLLGNGSIVRLYLREEEEEEEEEGEGEGEIEGERRRSVRINSSNFIFHH